jgi:hypothetical protein
MGHSNYAIPAPLTREIPAVSAAIISSSLDGKTAGRTVILNKEFAQK